MIGGDAATVCGQQKTPRRGGRGAFDKMPVGEIPT